MWASYYRNNFKQFKSKSSGGSVISSRISSRVTSRNKSNDSTDDSVDTSCSSPIETKSFDTSLKKYHNSTILNPFKIHALSPISTFKKNVKNNNNLLPLSFNQKTIIKPRHESPFFSNNDDVVSTDTPSSMQNSPSPSPSPSIQGKNNDNGDIQSSHFSPSNNKINKSSDQANGQGNGNLKTVFSFKESISHEFEKIKKQVKKKKSPLKKPKNKQVSSISRINTGTSRGNQRSYSDPTFKQIIVRPLRHSRDNDALVNDEERKINDKFESQSDEDMSKIINSFHRHSIINVSPLSSSSNHYNNGSSSSYNTGYTSLSPSRLLKVQEHDDPITPSVTPVTASIIDHIEALNLEGEEEKEEDGFDKIKSKLFVKNADDKDEKDDERDDDSLVIKDDNVLKGHGGGLEDSFDGSTIISSEDSKEKKVNIVNRLTLKLKKKISSSNNSSPQNVIKTRKFPKVHPNNNNDDIDFENLKETPKKISNNTLSSSTINSTNSSGDNMLRRSFSNMMSSNGSFSKEKSSNGNLINQDENITPLSYIENENLKQKWVKNVVNKIKSKMQLKLKLKNNNQQTENVFYNKFDNNWYKHTVRISVIIIFLCIFIITPHENSTNINSCPSNSHVSLYNILKQFVKNTQNIEFQSFENNEYENNDYKSNHVLTEESCELVKKNPVVINMVRKEIILSNITHSIFVYLYIFMLIYLHPASKFILLLLHFFIFFLSLTIRFFLFLYFKMHIIYEQIDRFTSYNLAPLEIKIYDCLLYNNNLLLSEVSSLEFHIQPNIKKENNKNKYMVEYFDVQYIPCSHNFIWENNQIATHHSYVILDVRKKRSFQVLYSTGLT